MFFFFLLKFYYPPYVYAKKSRYDLQLPIMQSAPNHWKRKVIGNKVLANVLNPLRNFVEKELPSVNLEQYPNRPSQCINLSIGDPTTSLDFRTHPENLKTFCSSVGKKDGYTNMQGLEASREALVKKFSTKGYDIGRDDAYLCAGGSMAIWVTMQLLAGEGDNFLFPSPGFPLGLVIAKSMGLEPRFYHLQAHNKWSASIEEMEKLIDDRTRFILVNDPSNPLGACWSVEQKKNILELSKRKNLPILGDEIYEGMIYGDMVPPFAELVEPQDADKITIFKCSGLTKRYLGPGWRMGWVIVYASEAKRNYYRPLLRGIFNVILMPNTVMQVALPEVLANPKNDEKMTACMGLMKINQQTLLDGLKDEEYCTFGYSAGALYATIILDLDKLNFNNSKEFAIKIYAEENVKIFPGDFFVGKVPFIRLVICCENAKVVTFLQRFKRFCRENYKK